jgi:NAD(P)-dependent dehydrogenase (short-subunit alcohol dehydrogenase family)
MRIDLKGKRALVTGSTSGIGLGIARQLAESGATVYVNGRDARRLEQAVAGLTGDVHGIAADVGTAAGVEALLQRAPDLDILVNNATVIGPRPFFETDDAQWQRAFDVTVMSAVRLTRHHAKRMIERRSGRILFNASVTGGFRPGEMVYYGAMKAALLGFSRTLAEELAGTGVTVNAFLPGPTLGEGNRPAVEAAARQAGKPLGELEREWMSGAIPSLLHRFLTPDEVGHLVVFLASEQAAAITGSGLRVDGGVVRSLL